MARTGNTSPEIVPKRLPAMSETGLMPRRRLYVLDLDTGREVKSIDVEGMPETKIIAFERQLWAQCGDELVVRDSSLDREDRRS